jgi:Protein of unknown function (DUF1573)
VHHHMQYQNIPIILRYEIREMKRILLSVIVLVLLVNGYSQPALPVQEDIYVKETIFDFGKIPQGKPVFHFFEVVNSGKTPMVISNIQTSCGCTTPEWSKEPIPPGESTKVKIGYNAAAEGNFEKSITLTYNQNLTKQINIKGTVWKAPVGAAPENSSIQLLKQKNN